MTLRDVVREVVLGMASERPVTQADLRRLGRSLACSVRTVRVLVTELENEGAIVVKRLSTLDHQPIEISVIRCDSTAKQLSPHGEG